MHSWRRRFEQEGMPGLLDRSRRPRNSPTRLSAEVEAEICQLRRWHPRWGARRISHELAGRGLELAPSGPARTPDRSPGPTSKAWAPPRETVKDLLTTNSQGSPETSHRDSWRPGDCPAGGQTPLDGAARGVTAQPVARTLIR
ncbi:helix-turn-helix domain-containing protein [Streptomyces sp. NPDC029004]|uniref:helix-turn-helix domain-containing protein n=1 Tax=Streptomyces sp. NPDC029004 TaxID=3154490 RepID=UPI0033CE5F49